MYNTLNSLPPQLMQSIQNARNLMCNQNAVNQAMNMMRGQSPEQLVRNLCNQRGINYEQFMNEIQQTLRTNGWGK